MFMNFYFCWDIDFFLFSGFSVVFSLKRHYIGFFKNIVYLCMQSTSVNMFSANWGETPPILIKIVFSGELLPLRKLKKIPGNQTVAGLHFTIVSFKLLSSNYLYCNLNLKIDYPPTSSPKRLVWNFKRANITSIKKRN